MKAQRLMPRLCGDAEQTNTPSSLASLARPDNVAPRRCIQGSTPFDQSLPLYVEFDDEHVSDVSVLEIESALCLPQPGAALKSPLHRM